MSVVPIAFIRGFASPQSGFDGPLLEHVAIADAHATLMTFRCIYADRIRDAHSGALEAIDAWFDDAPTFDSVWDPAFGGIASAIAHDDDDDDRRAAVLLLRFAECGRRVHCSLAFREPATLRFARWPIAECDALEIDAGAARVRVRAHTAAGSRSYAFDRAGNGWDAFAPDPTELAVVGATGWPIWTPALLDAHEYATLRAAASDGATARLARACSAAVTLIDSLGGPYAQWVRTVVRHIVPLEAVPRAFPPTLAAIDHAPGVVGIANHDHPIALADALVYQATLQYGAIARRFGALDDGSSPDAAAALATYHAYANVVLFCRAARHNGHDDPYIVFREADLTLKLAELAASLRTAHLTAAGEAVWSPLATLLDRATG
jgi:hypothetical protein